LNAGLVIFIVLIAVTSIRVEFNPEKRTSKGTTKAITFFMMNLRDCHALGIFQ